MIQDHSYQNKKEIEKSKDCGCFFCLCMLKPEDIKKWVDNGETAICPRCGIDSVIGDGSGVKVSAALLTKLYFERFEDDSNKRGST